MKISCLRYSQNRTQWREFDPSKEVEMSRETQCKSSHFTHCNHRGSCINFAETLDDYAKCITANERLWAYYVFQHAEELLYLVFVRQIDLRFFWIKKNICTNICCTIDKQFSGNGNDEDAIGKIFQKKNFYVPFQS